VINADIEPRVREMLVRELSPTLAHHLEFLLGLAQPLFGPVGIRPLDRGLPP
jgi:hypothetical protein